LTSFHLDLPYIVAFHNAPMMAKVQSSPIGAIATKLMMFKLMEVAFVFILLPFFVYVLNSSNNRHYKFPCQ